MAAHRVPNPAKFGPTSFPGRILNLCNLDGQGRFFRGAGERWPGSKGVVPRGLDKRLGWAGYKVRKRLDRDWVPAGLGVFFCALSSLLPMDVPPTCARRAISRAVGRRPTRTVWRKERKERKKGLRNATEP